MYDSATGWPVRTLTHRRELAANLRSEDSPGVLAATPDARRLVTAGDGAVCVWDLELGRECAGFARPKPHTAPASSGWDRNPHALAVSPDGGTLATDGGVDRRATIDLIDIRTGERLATLDGHREAVTCLNFAPDGRRLISGGADAAVFIWAVPPRPHKWLADPGVPWADLASADAVVAHRAVGLWSRAPEAAVAVARRDAAPPADPASVARLVADLALPEFRVREAASARLREFGPDARPQLVRAAASPDAEVAGRARALLAAASARPTVSRVVDVL